MDGLTFRAKSATVVWDDRFTEYDLGPTHPFRMESRGLAFRLVEAVTRGTPGFDRFATIRDVPPVPRAELVRFHSEEYVDRVERASDADFAPPLDAGDTPAFPGCFPAAGRVVGGTLAALAAITSAGSSMAANPSGGLHHAHPGRASGFCIFNDVAVGICRALDGPERFDRIAYVDIDAHHGDGVMYGFYDEGRLLDIDFHQDGRTIFPGTGSVGEVGRGDGAGLKVNIPLPPLAGDEAVIPLFDRVVPPLLRAHRPDLIILQHGMDAHVGDLLAQLQFTSAAYEHIVRELMALAGELSGGRLLLTGGGGYRADSVALGLARSMLQLGGATPDESSLLPDSWRAEFESTLNEPAPTGWRPAALLARSPWSSEKTEKLLSQLGQRLGREFPESR